MEIFNALDSDGSKAIGVSELEDPLIALGIVNSREEVKKYIDQVDQDDTGEIEFDEFLLIMRDIKNKDKSKSSDNSLYSFFKDMIEGNFNKRGDMDNDIPFMLNFSQYRRRRIIDAIVCKEDKEDEKRKLGQKILNVNLENIILRTSKNNSSIVRMMREMRKEKKKKNEKRS